MFRIGEGSVKEYLRVYHYLFLDYNAQIASDIVSKHNVELSFANDKVFVDGVYRLCRDMLAYTPRLTKDQFFHAGFAQAKAEMAADIIEKVRGFVHGPAVIVGGNNSVASLSSAAVNTRLRAESSEREGMRSTNRSTVGNTSPPLVLSTSSGVSTSSSSSSIVSKTSISASSLARQPSTKSVC